MTRDTPCDGARIPVSRALRVYWPKAKKQASSVAKINAAAVSTEKETGRMRTTRPSHRVERASCDSSRNSGSGIGYDGRGRKRRQNCQATGTNSTAMIISGIQLVRSWIVARFFTQTSCPRQRNRGQAGCMPRALRRRATSCRTSSTRAQGPGRGRPRTGAFWRWKSPKTIDEAITPPHTPQRATQRFMRKPRYINSSPSGAKTTVQVKAMARYLASRGSGRLVESHRRKPFGLHLHERGEEPRDVEAISPTQHHEERRRNVSRLRAR